MPKNQHKLIDLTGLQFGMLTVKGRAENKGRHPRWHCLCQCGVVTAAMGHHLRVGASTNCGCVRRTQNGLAKTREYGIWQLMIARCHNPAHNNYGYYGALGTYVCERWRESVSHFVADMGEAPSAGHTLDRIDTHGNYTCGKCPECQREGQPANCRWATKAVQVRNAKSNRYYTHDGKTLILKDWARLSGVKYLTLWGRLDRGVPFADAISAGRYAVTRIKRQ